MNIPLLFGETRKVSFIGPSDGFGGWAIARLDSICDVKISKNDRAAIDASKRLRNSIQHFRFSVTEKEAKIVIGKMLAFILDFSEGELDYSIRRDHQRDDRLRELLEFGEFYQEYSKRSRRKCYVKISSRMHVPSVRCPHLI